MTKDEEMAKEEYKLDAGIVLLIVLVIIFGMFSLIFWEVVINPDQRIVRLDDMAKNLCIDNGGVLIDYTTSDTTESAIPYRFSSIRCAKIDNIIELVNPNKQTQPPTPTTIKKDWEKICEKQNPSTSSCEEIDYCYNTYCTDKYRDYEWQTKCLTRLTPYLTRCMNKSNIQ